MQKSLPGANYILGEEPGKGNEAAHHFIPVPNNEIEDNIKSAYAADNAQFKKDLKDPIN
jgi:hypothetical protein